MISHNINIGLQTIIDITGCDDEVIHNIDLIKMMMYKIAELMNTTIIKEVYHQFDPIGITMIAIVADSHIAIHTWPEYQHVSIDIFSCKMNIPDSIVDYISQFFKSTDYRFSTFERKLINSKVEPYIERTK